MDTDATDEAPDVQTDLLRLADGRIALQDSRTPDAWLATDTAVELPHR